MNNKILLDKEIENLLNELKKVDPETEEYGKIRHNLTELYKLRQDDEKSEREHLSKLRESEEKDKEFQHRKKHDNAKTISDIVLGVGGIVLPIVAKTLMFRAGLHFETYGSIQSPFVRNLIDVNPAKK